jgi:hypothetical protein
MKEAKAKAYVTMWATKDTDGTRYIHRVDDKGEEDIAPFTFASKEAAAHYIQAHFPNNQTLSA